MAVTLGIALFTAPRPEGLMDGVVWPFAYGLAGVASLGLAIRPQKIYLHAWCALVSAISLIRAVLLGINPTVPGLRLASISSNIFLAALAYVVWGGWKDRLPGDKNNPVITLPVQTVQTLLTPYDEAPGTITLKERIEEHERVQAVMNGTPEVLPLPPTLDPESEYRLPRVPGLN